MAKMTIQWHTERRKVADLRDYPKNPRTFTEKGMADLKASLTSLGYIDPIAINLDGTIIGGHARKHTLIALGLHEIDVRVPDRQLTAKEVDEAIIRLNKNVAGVWDYKVLEDSFQKAELVKWGFEKHEFNQFAPTKGNTDPDEEVTIPSVAVTQVGDQWMLGNHSVRCGDSTRSEDVALLMGGKVADLLLTDPPYNVSYEGKTKDALKIQNDSMNDESFRLFLRNALTAADGVMRPGAMFYIWHADSEGYNFRGACKDAGWRVRQCLVWHKQTMVMDRQDYHWRHEPCLYGWKDGASHLWAADRKQTTILEFDRPSRSGQHPTMKPVALFEYQIKNSTVDENVVLDLFGGSGTTLIACERLGREARLMELDPVYVDVIVTRWQNFTGKQAVHAVTGEPFPHVDDKPVVETKKKPAKAKG